MDIDPAVPLPQARMRNLIRNSSTLSEDIRQAREQWERRDSEVAELKQTIVMAATKVGGCLGGW